MIEPALLHLAHISKSFGPVRALADVSLRVGVGEVLGLVGDNAAGKSTLMKILTGAYQPDAGEIVMPRQIGVPAFGHPEYITGMLTIQDVMRFRSPEESRSRGIEMVYQDLALVDCLDVAANVFLGREIVGWRIGPLRFLDKRAMREATGRLLADLGIEVENPAEIVGNLSGGQRQAVAIARAAAFGARLVILDEPTAALSVHAIERVHHLIRRLKHKNVAVILISHRLDDILEVCDSAAVLYQGRLALEVDLKRNDRRWNRDWLLRAMEGRNSEGQVEN